MREGEGWQEEIGLLSDINMVLPVYLSKEIFEKVRHRQGQVCQRQKEEIRDHAEERGTHTHTNRERESGKDSYKGWLTGIKWPCRLLCPWRIFLKQ